MSEATVVVGAEPGPGGRPDPTPPQQPRRPSAGSGDQPQLPAPLVIAAAWAWRVIVILAALALLVVVMRALSLVVIPVAVALLLTVLLTPLVRLLSHRTPLGRNAAALIALLTLLAVVVGLLAVAGSQLASGAAELRFSAEAGLRQVTVWLATGPLHVTGDQLGEYLTQLQDTIRNNSSQLTSGALAVGATALDFLAGTLICLITTFFFLAQGERIWQFVVGLLPRAAGERTGQAFRRGWVSLGAYARTQVIVAGVDAVGIGLGALILGLPFVIPLTLLVFVASFVPIVGAIVSGAVAVLVALVVKGPIVALIMLGIVLLVQQVESHLLQPFLMGHAVALHPLAVIIAVAIGAHLLGVVGALFAVPTLAVANSVIRYFVGQDMFPHLTPRATEEEVRS